MVPRQLLSVLLDLADSTLWKTLQVILAFLIAWLCYHFVRFLVRRTVRSMQGDKLTKGLIRMRKRTPRVFLQTDNYSILRHSQRVETVGALVRSVSAIVLFGIAIVFSFRVYQLNVAPLLTSTALATAVLAFGAQNIVRDFLAGFFIVMEDQFGVGDFIDVGTASGTVEAVSLRITRIRNSDGTLWQIPNGEIKRVGNKSQRWSRSLVEFRVNLNTDVRKVTEIATRVSEDIAEDENFREKILETPEVWSPDAIDGEGILFKIAIKTRPLEQWRISREVRARMKAAFDAEGIRIASTVPDIYGYPVQGLDEEEIPKNKDARPLTSSEEKPEEKKGK